MVPPVRLGQGDSMVAKRGLLAAASRGILTARGGRGNGNACAQCPGPSYRVAARGDRAEQAAFGPLFWRLEPRRSTVERPKCRLGPAVAVPHPSFGRQTRPGYPPAYRVKMVLRN